MSKVCVLPNFVFGITWFKMCELYVSIFLYSCFLLNAVVHVESKAYTHFRWVLKSGILRYLTVSGKQPVSRNKIKFKFPAKKKREANKENLAFVFFIYI